jgi:wyosine [tRNA(Phe)-imidazoG37] synthetase (radical SAM superfamily)
MHGIEEFAAAYRGELLTETMLVDGVNDDVDAVESVAAFLVRLAPSRLYLAVHPMKESAVSRYLSEVGTGPESMDALLASGRVKRAEYLGEVFYVRSLAG